MGKTSKMFPDLSIQIIAYTILNSQNYTKISQLCGFICSKDGTHGVDITLSRETVEHTFWLWSSGTILLSSTMKIL